MPNRPREPYSKWRGQAGRLRRRSSGQRRPTPETPPANPTPAQPGHAPDVGLETTHLGPVMDEAVLRAKRRMRIGADPDYDLLYENFDVLHYLLQAPDLLDDPDVDLIEHYLEYGRAEGLSPHPNFSMTEYTDRYPHKTSPQKVRDPFLYWLKHGRAAGHIADPAPRINRVSPVLGLKPEQVADLVAERRRDLQQRFRTGRLGEVFARAAEIEPLIGATWTEIARPHLIPLSRRVVVDEICTLYQAHEVAGFRRARVVLVTDRTWSGGDGLRIDDHLALALAAHVDPHEIVVISTDDDTTEDSLSRFPDGVRQIDFARIARDLPKERAEHALVMLLRTFHADTIVNVESRMLYDAMRSYGRALAATERLFLCFFGNEQTVMGTWAGRSLSYFYRTFDYVAGVITDSDHLARELTETYRVGEKDRERLHVFRAPVNAALPVLSESPARPGRRPQVFWAGPSDRQKDIELLLVVARLMPEVDFRMWGESLANRDREALGNVRMEETHTHVSELPLAEADVWLYTTDWDGVPSRLLEIAMTGIPVVGSLVGGTGEVLSEDDAWPVAEDEGVQAYVAAIRAALDDPSGSRRRALALRERMLRERTEKAFATQAADVLLTADESEEGGR